MIIDFKNDPFITQHVKEWLNKIDELIFKEDITEEEKKSLISYLTDTPSEYDRAIIINYPEYNKKELHYTYMNNQKEIVVNNVTIPYDDHEPCGKDYIEFYDQNKIKSIDVWSCQEDIDWIGTFTKSNNNLTISNGSESKTVEIIELNTNSLIYKYDFDADNDGTNEHYIEKFTRQ